MLNFEVTGFPIYFKTARQCDESVITIERIGLKALVNVSAVTESDTGEVSFGKHCHFWRQQ